MRQMPMWKGLEKLAPTLVYDSEVLGEGHALPAPSSRASGRRRLSCTAAPDLRRCATPPRRSARRFPKPELRTLDRQTHGVSPKALVPVLEEFFG